MKINSIVVIDHNMDSRIRFGVALEDIRQGMHYYPLEHIDEALTIPNGLIEEVPDIIFINLDAEYSDGPESILSLRNIVAYKNIPIVAYGNFEVNKLLGVPGVSHYFRMPHSNNALVKFIAPIISGRPDII